MNWHTTSICFDFDMIRYLAPRGHGERGRREKVKGLLKFQLVLMSNGFQPFVPQSCSSFNRWDWVMGHKRGVMLHGSSLKGVGAVLATLCGGSRWRSLDWPWPGWAKAACVPRFSSLVLLSLSVLRCDKETRLRKYGIQRKFAFSTAPYQKGIEKKWIYC